MRTRFACKCSDGCTASVSILKLGEKRYSIHTFPIHHEVVLDWYDMIDLSLAIDNITAEDVDLSSKFGGKFAEKIA